MRLTREVRMSIPPAGVEPGPLHNAWAGWPSVGGLAPYLLLRLTVEGDVDPERGYLLNIKEIDQRLRDVALPLLWTGTGPLGRHMRFCPAELVVSAVWNAIDDPFDRNIRPVGLELFLTPYLRYAMSSNRTREISVTQSFEFAASHRLFAPTLSEAENTEVFGKCANPSGHGHNYRVDVTLAGTPDERTGILIRLDDFEATVMERVINRFDHKHLNADCPEFAELNPSVENITRTIWGLLEGRFGAARLANVRVWETPKTWADCSAAESTKG